MKAPLAILVSAMLLPLAAHGGTITGTVRAQAKAGVETDASRGAYQSRKLKFAERVEYGDLRDFVVYIDQPVGDKPVPPAAPVQMIVQKDATFSPHVLPVVVGTTVEWPNRDEIYHNAFSFSEAKPFDLGLYKEKAKDVTFDKPGRVDVFCSIHKNMNCIILVLENPFYAATDAKGRYAILNVPAGKYRVKAWHERLPSQTADIIVPDHGDVRADFTLGITGLPQY